MKKITYIGFILLFIFFSNNNAQTDIGKNQKIKIEVEGLSCPFCAYGLEKKLKKLDNIKNMEIDFKKGIVFLTIQNSKKISDEQLKQAVINSGFTPKKIIRD